MNSKANKPAGFLQRLKSLLHNVHAALFWPVLFVVWCFAISRLLGGWQSSNAAEKITGSVYVVCDEAENKKEGKVSDERLCLIPICDGEGSSAERFADRHAESQMEKTALLYQEIQRPVGACQFKQPQVGGHVSGNAQGE